MNYAEKGLLILWPWLISPLTTYILFYFLFQFLCGLSTLDYKNDSFIKRKLKEIFSKYFLMITKVCGTFLVPFVCNSVLILALAQLWFFKVGLLKSK